MKRPVLIHGVLLSAALVAAYFTWTREPTSAATEDEVPVISLRGNLDRVIYKGDERTVEIERRKDERGAYHWVRVESMELPPHALPKMTPPPAPPRPEQKKAEPPKPEPKKAEAKGKKPGESLSHDPKADPSKAGPTKPEEKKPEAKPATAMAPAPSAPPKPVVKVRKVQEFKGSKSVEELMKGLANLTAVRSLGKVDGDKLKAFGFEGSKKSLTLISGSSPREFIIGGTTYGNMDTYIQSREDGRVYVIRPRLLQDFQYAEFRLMDRSLQSFENNEVERAIVAGPDGKKRTLVQGNRRDPAGAFWADESAPEQRKELFKNWMSKVLGLRILEYVPPSKKIEGLKPVLAVEYQAGSRSIGFMRLFKKEGAAAAKIGAAPDEGAGDYYALTENTRALVKISRQVGDEVARDVTNILRE